jgi:hypothetical protein
MIPHPPRVRAPKAPVTLGLFFVSRTGLSTDPRRLVGPGFACTDGADGRFSPGLHVPVDEPLADRLSNARSTTSPTMSSDTSRDPRSAGLKATTGTADEIADHRLPISFGNVGLGRRHGRTPPKSLTTRWTVTSSGCSDARRDMVRTHWGRPEPELPWPSRSRRWLYAGATTGSQNIPS